jgi:hypothetical protein
MKRVGLTIAYAVLSGTSLAETADYQIRRLIYLGSSCGLEALERIDATPGNERFKATCKNVGSFPYGLEVVCSDPFDDRSCRIVTIARNFDQLELLQPKTSR